VSDYAFCILPPEHVTLQVLMVRMIEDSVIHMRIVLPSEKDGENPFMAANPCDLAEQRDLECRGYKFVYRFMPETDNFRRAVLCVTPQLKQEIDDSQVTLVDVGDVSDSTMKKELLVVYAPTTSKIIVQGGGIEVLDNIIEEFSADRLDWRQYVQDIRKNFDGSVIVLTSTEQVDVFGADYVMLPVGFKGHIHSLPIRYYVCDQAVTAEMCLSLRDNMNLAVGADPYVPDETACYRHLLKDDVMFPIEGGELPPYLNDGVLSLLDALPPGKFRERVCARSVKADDGVFIHVLPPHFVCSGDCHVTANGYKLFMLLSHTYRVSHEMLMKAKPLELVVYKKEKMYEVGDRVTEPMDFMSVLFRENRDRDLPNCLTRKVVKALYAEHRSAFRSKVCVIRHDKRLWVKRVNHVCDETCHRTYHGFDALRRVVESYIRPD